MSVIKKEETIFQELLKAHAVPPVGVWFYGSLDDIRADASFGGYTHVLIKAWREFQLSGIVSVNGVPTLYLRCFNEPLSPESAAQYHRQFWNQGVATILVLADPHRIRLYSGLAVPVGPGQEPNEKSLIDTLSLTNYALGLKEFYLQLATGQYYRNHREKFDPMQSVNFYLLDNLAAIRDAITTGKDGLELSEAHAFLARVLFTSYLIDRGIIELTDYEYGEKGSGGKLVDLLDHAEPQRGREILFRLFDDLKDKFNGSMFEYGTKAEREHFGENHLRLLVDFLRGHKIGSRQLSLGFWAYDFRWIPVETISAVYEDFLAKEDQGGKQKSGAFYTPRFLAETVLDVTLEKDNDWASKRFLDPSCGSGIFLVTLFSRLASRWCADNPAGSYREKATALLGIMRDRLCGVDISSTACRIACFSLYLAFLDQFDPPDIKGYVEQTGKKLPKILQFADPDAPPPDFPVIVEQDFLQPTRPLPGQFDYIIGNPPWSGRGSKQIAQDFALKAPRYLTEWGKVCILLPSKVLFNETAIVFQKQWLSMFTVEKVVQLADYRFILFRDAKCPCIIARYSATPPDMENHYLDYETPKVGKTDPREGIIAISPADRKKIPLRDLLSGCENNPVPMVWKQYLWGTPRDLKFLGYLLEMPTLGGHVDVLSELRKTSSPRTKRWAVGQGFKPYKKGKGQADRRLVSMAWRAGGLFLGPGHIKKNIFPQSSECVDIVEHLAAKEYLPDKLYSKPPEELFIPPLVLVNQGFSVCAFIDYPVYFQDSFQSISGPPEDEDLLLFLTFYLRSKFAKYFLFHTAANWGTERDKVHLHELLRLPFPLPGDEDASPDAALIVRKVVQKARVFKEEVAGRIKGLGGERFTGQAAQTVAAWRAKRVEALQAEVELLIYRYFDLIDQEIILIEDTVEISITSATPHGMNTRIATRELIHKNKLPRYHAGLSRYAVVLTGTINDWAPLAGGNLLVHATGGVYEGGNLALITLEQTEQLASFRQIEVSRAMGDILARLQDTVRLRGGGLDYLRGIIWFEGTRIRIVKPLDVASWTETAALNDAAEIHARIATARQTASGRA